MSLEREQIQMTQNINIKKLNENAVIPTYGSAFAAGADLYACMEESVTIAAGKTEFIKTGIALEIPAGFAGLIYARSGLACKKGLAPANKVGVIDADYRGEIMVALHNHSGEPVTVNHGERIAQLVITPYLTAVFHEADELSDTVRGEGGFGSTGVN
jgi:dUTP pyrophosphatase